MFFLFGLNFSVVRCTGFIGHANLCTPSQINLQDLVNGSVEDLDLLPRDTRLVHNDHSIHRRTNNLRGVAEIASIVDANDEITFGCLLFLEGGIDDDVLAFVVSVESD